MKPIRFILVFLMAAGGISARATGWQHAGSVIELEELPDGVRLTTATCQVKVQAVARGIIRVRMDREGRFPTGRSWAILPGELKTTAVEVNDSAETVDFATKQVKVQIQKNPLVIEFFDLRGNRILSDLPSRPAAFEGEKFRIWKEIPTGEHYYGLGEKSGRLNRRGRAYTMWNTDAFGWQEGTDPLYKSIPFFLALRDGRAYGIYLDNTWRVSFDFGQESPEFYSFGSEGGPLDYYFIYGPDPKMVIREFTRLTGRMPLPPLWTLGYQQCRYSYYPESRVREVAQTLRTKKIPADSIYLDIHYQRGFRPFTVDRQRFPTFEKMVKDLTQQGFKTIAITDLHLKQEDGYPPYDQGMGGDHFVKNPDGTTFVGKVWPGDSVFPEFTLEWTRNWWGTLYREFVSMGIRGFWNDMNEPAVFERADKTMPLDTVHRLDDGRKTSHREIHNIFGTLNARATYEGLRKLKPDLRPFVLTRAAFAGAWRWAASWTGDNTSSWNHLRLTVPSLLGLGISGYAYVGVDIGGFDGSPPPDLLTRWIQLGVFNPMFRNHTRRGTADQEPWVHGKQHEDIRRQYIELRYRLMPYIYTGLEETTRTGLPLMRPIFLEYPREESLADNDRQFLFGRDLLVAARLTEMQGPYEVKLPPGEWYDYWTGSKKTGSFPVDPGLDELPVYARAGAIIPHQPVVQYLEQKPEGPLTLRIFPGPDCRGSIYLDDGQTFAYLKGETLRVNFTCQPGKEALTIRISPQQGKYTPWWSRIRLEVFGVNPRPRNVQVGQKQTSDWTYDGQQKKLIVEIPNLPSGGLVRAAF